MIQISEISIKISNPSAFTHPDAFLVGWEHVWRGMSVYRVVHHQFLVEQEGIELCI